MTPTDVAARYTLDWVIPLIGPQKKRVLEIGCGAGHMAAGLQEFGHQVIGIDADTESVARTRRRGVEAHVARWPECQLHGDFDVVLLSRSLHHISELDEAIRAAKRISSRGGMLLVEDFSWNEAERTGVEWLYQVVQVAQAGGLTCRPCEMFTQVDRTRDVMAAWHREHDHDLHTWPAMLAAVKREYEAGEFCRTPYLFRYLVDVLDDSPEAAAVARAAIALELRHSDLHGTAPIGRRLFATAS